MEINHNTFFITGGASGLGLATAQMIIDQGGNVILADINEEAGNTFADAHASQVMYAKVNVTVETDIVQAIANGIARFGVIHGLICCAGIGPAQRVVGKDGPHDLDLFTKVIQINLIGSFNAIRLLAKAMQSNQPNIEGERGVIINTASVAAFDGQIGQAAYAASKGGIVSMTLPIARELARSGIRVMTIAPGIFETPLMQNFSEEVKKSLGSQVPFPPRLGRPSEFAMLVQQIITNPMLNGEVIRLDGALRMKEK